eukprot:scaffold2507_cov122-Isochrysis_galbana.AAC.5
MRPPRRAHRGRRSWRDTWAAPSCGQPRVVADKRGGHGANRAVPQHQRAALLDLGGQFRQAVGALHLRGGAGQARRVERCWMGARGGGRLGHRSVHTSGVHLPPHVTGSHPMGQGRTPWDRVARQAGSRHRDAGD